MAYLQEKRKPRAEELNRYSHIQITPELEERRQELQRRRRTQANPELGL